MARSGSCDLIAQALRYTLGGTAFLAGADKFTNLLADWDQYLSPMVSRRLPIGDRNFMRLVGVIEMAVGASILKGNTRAGGYIAGAWLLGISANLISSGKYLDIAARDVNMAMAAFALARLSARERQRRLAEEDIEVDRAA